MDADNDCATSGIGDNAPALQTQSGETVTLTKSDDEIIEIERNQVTAQDDMSSIGLIRLQSGFWRIKRAVGRI